VFDPRAAARLDEIARDHGLSRRQHEALARLVGLLAADPLAPTTVTHARHAVDVHVSDSLTALELPEVRAATAIGDIGAGAGFPGLPLAIAVPTATVTLIESNRRKCLFLERAVAVAEVANVQVAACRVEEWPPTAGVFDVVTARALAPLAVLCEYAAPLLRRGGVLVAWKASPVREEIDAADHAATELGLLALETIRSLPFPETTGHRLHRYAKVADTPARFPRRPGVARKRPLGARSAP
jgi:16S rRNA (guanine527-N7)-methyltransferase